MQAFLFPDFEPEPLSQADASGDNARMFFSPDGVLTVREVVAEFCTHRKSIYTERSFAERKPILDRFVGALGDKPVGQCRPIDLDRWIAAQTGWRSPATRRTQWNLIMAVMNWAGRVQLIAKNPFSSGEVPDGGDPRPAVPDDLLLTLLRHTDACFRRFLVFVRVSSLRPGEVIGLMWPEVDLQNGLLRIEKHKTRKKTRKAKVVPLTLPALKLLAFLGRHRTGAASDRVFLNADGNPWTRTNVSTRMQRLRKRAGVPSWVKIHGLRHQAASQAVGSGAPLKLVSQGLGHAGTAITEKFYLSLDPYMEEVRGALALGAHIRVRQ